ncbi:macoilin-1-like [Trichoplusia ni]|uniref:Macoilin n=1 Tax=Trichoplusia ni TaxID=7111 RepID=A0A7E5WNJ5_TRINI|nr:macoilin-1-like [Trichoplusia ni]
MKRRNAETGKLRRPLKRTKITEGMYGNSMLYLKFVMIWATVVMADYMLEFRFEFLWPFWMMLRSVYDSFKYQGLAFSVFFICIALTSDMICFFFIPLQYIFFAASTYVWVQYVWYTFADKGICVPTVAICCLLVYVEGLWRGSRGGGGSLCRPLAAHCVGYPVVTLGFGAKALLAHRLRQRRQRHVRAMNEFYFQLMRDALPETAVDQTQSQQQPQQQASTKEGVVANGGSECGTQTQPQSQTQAQAPADARHMNGSLRRCRFKTADHNGHCPQEHAQLQAKLEKLEKHLAAQSANREREKAGGGGTAPSSSASSSGSCCSSRPLSNGAAAHADDDDAKGGVKLSKLEKKEAYSTLKEEKRKNKSRDKDKENSDSHKSTENTKEHIVKDKDVESTKECIKIKECSNKELKEKEKEKEREREMKEKEKERERERERELRSARECSEELKRVRVELAAARAAEQDARRALAAAAAAERQRRADHHQLKQAHQALQHKLSAWRTGERASLERRLGEERRARSAAEAQLLRAKHAARPPRYLHLCVYMTFIFKRVTYGVFCRFFSITMTLWYRETKVITATFCKSLLNGLLEIKTFDVFDFDIIRYAECESELCRSRRAAAEAEGAALRRDLTRARERAAQLQRDLGLATDQVRSLESLKEQHLKKVAAAAELEHEYNNLQKNHTYLESSLSSETRVKLDLLSALGEAKRKLHIQEGLISRQDKEMEELKAQLLAVMPPAFPGAGASQRRLDASPLDPNACVYTPKQLALASDA